MHVRTQSLSITKNLVLRTTTDILMRAVITSRLESVNHCCSHQTPHHLWSERWIDDHRILYSFSGVPDRRYLWDWKIYYQMNLLVYAGTKLLTRLEEKSNLSSIIWLRFSTCHSLWSFVSTYTYLRPIRRWYSRRVRANSTQTSLPLVEVDYYYNAVIISK